MIFLRAALIVLVTCFSFKAFSNDPSHGFWYNKPATDWHEALPVGNGRMGAMIFSDPLNERIQLNDDSLWPGDPDWVDNNKGTPEDLEDIRKLLREGNHVMADSLLVERFSNKSVKFSHQTLGDMMIKFENHQEYSDYKRWLSLDSAIVSSVFTIPGGKVKQQVFSSNPDNVLIVRLETTAPQGLTCSIRLSRPEDNGHKTVMVNSVKDGLVMDGMVTQYGGMIGSKPYPVVNGVKFSGLLKAKSEGGKIKSEKGILKLDKVKTATLYFFCNTSWYRNDYKKQNIKQWDIVNAMSFNELLHAHVSDFKSIYNRVSLKLVAKNSEVNPLNERLEFARNGKSDPALEALLFQFGRYLLISSSRPGTNPANLQGLWNKDIEAAWNADYHLNINLAMNYWPAEVTNLSEMHEPLFDYLDRLVENGKKTAQEQYGCRGSVVHHATDLWAPTWMRAAQAYWGAWMHGGGWLAQHLWTHFEFTQDEQFLKSRIFPILKELAMFYSDWLQVDTRNGQLISFPSTSPENSFITVDGSRAASCMGAAMDQQIIQEVFDNFIKSAEILNISNELTEEIKEKRSKLRSGIQIGPDGRLMEWDQPYEEYEKGHRHMSHLYAFYPANQITYDYMPEITEAVKKTIEYRLQNGGAGPGWSRAWLINFAARLKNPEMAHEHIEKFIFKSLGDNLFCLHPPFQIDGNFGYSAGIAEMLIQSHQGFIELLPALPETWHTGEITGLRARGGFEVNMKWEKGNLLEVNIKSLAGKKTSIRNLNNEFQINLKKGESRKILFQ
jgi:alpha-L-fucosidase 2